MKLKFFLLVALITTALLMSGCTEPTSDYPTQENGLEIGYVSATLIIEKDNEDVLVKTVQIENGKNGLQAMQEAGIKFESQYYPGAGTFVTSIMDAKGDQQYYWALYVDGKYAEKSIDAYVLDDDTEIKWIYEAIDFTQFGE